MCLAIPGKIVEFTNELDEVFRMAKVDYDGVQKEVNMAMLPEAEIGDFVMVHVGLAISIVDEDEAQKTMHFLKKMGEFNDEIIEKEKKKKQ